VQQCYRTADSETNGGAYSMELLHQSSLAYVSPTGLKPILSQSE
jgi:hypothetical protein